MTEGFATCTSGKRARSPDREITHIRYLRSMCLLYGLENSSILSRYSDERLAEIYSGIGPDSFPEWANRLISISNPFLEPVAMIHDVEWNESEGTRESFTESNVRFRRNGKKIAHAIFSKYDPMRAYVCLSAKAMSFMCQTFGWRIWIGHHNAQCS